MKPRNRAAKIEQKGNEITLHIRMKVHCSLVDAIKLAILKGAFPALGKHFERLRRIK